MTAKPSPRITAETRRFWQSCNEGRLTFQRCAACARPQFYPGTICRTCQSDQLNWEDASGDGAVYSFTVVHRAPSPAFRGDVPYVLALVDMDEGFRLMANVVDTDAGLVRIGLPVRTVFEPRGEDGQKIPQVTARV